MEEVQNNAPVAQPKKNGMAVAGFVLALVGFGFMWIPLARFLGPWVFGLLGLIFSIIGACKSSYRRVLAIVGIVIVVVMFILWYTVIPNIVANNIVSGAGAIMDLVN